MDMQDVENAAMLPAKHGARVEIVGSWVWAYFPAKPSEDVRNELKAGGYHWNRKRKCWQFAGRPSGGSKATADELKDKYGVVSFSTI